MSFKNSLIVMTSNVGSSAIARGGSHRIGFGLDTDEEDGGRYSSLKELVTDELKSFFRPELLNRLDEIVVFRSLEKSQVRRGGGTERSQNGLVLKIMEGWLNVKI